MTAGRPLRALLPVVLVATGGCLATKGDVTLLQLQIKAAQDSSRVQQARSDSLTRALVREMSQQLGQQFARDFNALSDSVRLVAANQQRLQGDVQLSMHDLRAQLAAVQEGMSQSTRRISALTNTVEANTQAPAPRPGVTAPAAGDVPPASQLYTSGRNSLIGGAPGAARDALQTFVDKYPNDERVPEAQAFIAQAFAQDHNLPAADSVYALVASKYPNSVAAAQALYKRALLARDAGNKARAVDLLQQVLTKYPKSDEASLAPDLIKTLKPSP